MGLEGQTVLVTGGAGFIGSHLAAALAADNEVRVLDNLAGGTLANVPSNVEFVEADLRNEGQLRRVVRGVDCVFHEAAMASVTDSIRRPRDCHDVNATATVELLDCARRADARIVLASSAAVYGTPESTPIPESARLEPESPYGVSKLAAEKYAAIYADQYDLPTVALRYFNVYGPRQSAGGSSGVVSTFLRRAACGDSLIVEGDGEQTRDFVHVSDVVRANLLAATTDHVGEAFNVGTGESISIAGLAERIRAKTGEEPPVEHTDPRPGDVRHSRADLTKARGQLGYDPQVDLDDGLRSVLDRGLLPPR